MFELKTYYLIPYSPQQMTILVIGGPITVSNFQENTYTQHV